MKISKQGKQSLIDELKFVKEKMAQEKDIKRKMFFYSGIHGHVSRILNLEYDPHLQFMHLILNVTYNAINQRINLIAAGDNNVILPPNFFEELESLIQILVEYIESDADTYSILEKISNLAYLTTGNGYYLSEKGVKMFER